MTPDSTPSRTPPPRWHVCTLCDGRGQIVGLASPLGQLGSVMVVRDRCSECLGSGWAPWETVQ